MLKPDIIKTLNIEPKENSMKFKELGLHPSILKAVEDSGFVSPTPVQKQAIPQVLNGCDLLASAQTGTGKTASFILPALHRLTVSPKSKGRGPRILILVPTRELAIQVAAESVKYSKHLAHLKTLCIFGGIPYPIQKKQLAKPFDILVATPGRLLDHLQAGRINFKSLEMFVLDEADRLLDMGFIEDVEKIAGFFPHRCQTLLFSATLKESVLNLSGHLLQDPKKIQVEPEFTKHQNIEQRLHNVDDLNHKVRLLIHLLEEESLQQTIVFTSTKMYADKLTETLQQRGHLAASLHGDIQQHKRTKTIMKMRQGKIRILVATDVAARGIDIHSVGHVINFDLPRCTEDYVHRIGRTGRANATGVAISFASAKDAILVQRIEKYTGHKITPFTILGMEAKKKKKASRKPQKLRLKKTSRR